MNHKLWNIVLTKRDIYFICRCYWNVTTYKQNVHNGEKNLATFCSVSISTNSQYIRGIVHHANKYQQRNNKSYMLSTSISPKRDRIASQHLKRTGFFCLTCPQPSEIDDTAKC